MSAAGTSGPWPDSAGPARQPTTRQPGGPSPSGHAQPQPYRPAPQERENPAASPTRRDHSDPDRRSMARPGRVCLLGWRTIRAWLCRCAMADAAPPAPDRWCAPSAKPELAPMTAAPLGSPGYNQGWDQQETTRTRQHRF
jgi:hypothetical protein